MVNTKHPWPTAMAGASRHAPPHHPLQRLAIDRHWKGGLYGFTMVLPWFNYGFTMVLLWFYYVLLAWFVFWQSEVTINDSTQHFQHANGWVDQQRYGQYENGHFSAAVEVFWHHHGCKSLGMIINPDSYYFTAWMTIPIEKTWFANHIPSIEPVSLSASICMYVYTYNI